MVEIMRRIESDGFVIKDDEEPALIFSEIPRVIVTTKSGYKIGSLPRFGSDMKGFNFNSEAGHTLSTPDLRELADLIDQWNNAKNSK